MTGTAGLPFITTGMASAATRTALAQAELPMGAFAYLTEPGREGIFVVTPGAVPPGDRLQGLFVAGVTRERHFARVWDRIAGQPEWFGARTNDWRFDCAAAIEACFTWCPVTRLDQGDYFIRRTLVLAQSWRTMVGVGTFATDQAHGTRIVLQAQAPGVGDADVVLVGSRRQPGATSASFATEIHLAQFTVMRDGPATPHPSGDMRRYPAGLRMAFVTRCTLSRIASLDSSVGFYFGGTVYSKVDDCTAQRLRAGDGGGRDLAAGFYLDGSLAFELAGGNASLYLNRCLAVGQHVSHVEPTGLIAEGAFVDSFIDAFESARIDNGIRCSAAGAAAAGQTIDLHIRNCVLDGCGGTALDLDLTGTQAASVEIADPYVYAAAGGGARGIAIRDGGGLVTVLGGQVHGDFHDGSLLLQRTRGVRVEGLKLHEGSHPAIVRDSGALQVDVQTSNLQRRTNDCAILCTGMYRSSLRPLIIGAPGMLAGGVSLDGACNYSAIDGSAIDPGCFVEVSSTRKVRFAGADATQGTGAAGFARAGNVVTGVIG